MNVSEELHELGQSVWPDNIAAKDPGLKECCPCADWATTPYKVVTVKSLLQPMRTE